jgi:hypothetical protein
VGFLRVAYDGIADWIWGIRGTPASYNLEVVRWLISACLIPPQ